jgi:hypothetical protein
MGVAETFPLWENICRLAGVDPQESGALDRVHEALNGCVGRGTFQRIQSGGDPQTRSVNRIAKELGVNPGELLSPPGIFHAPQAESDSVARALSERQQIVTPQTLAWGGFVLADVKGEFIMAVAGDALAPHYLPGDMLVWEACDFGRPGKAVLLADQMGGFHLRIYQPRIGGSWAGVPGDRPGHAELQPERDGVRIVARSKWRSED